MTTLNPFKIWIGLLISMVGLIVSTVLAKRGVLVLGEEHLLSAIYNWPESFRIPFLILTLLGSTWILAVVLIVLLIKQHYALAVRVMAAGLSAGIFASLAKTFVARPRPVLLTEILQREIFVLGYGFPSGHVALATAIALTIGYCIPRKYRYVPIAWIGIVAVSRLYLGVHAPLDIVGGFCIGVIAALCVRIALPDGKKIHRFHVAKKHKQG